MERTKKILFIVLLTAMFLPMLQKSLKIPKLRGLKGYFTVHEEPDFLLKNWFTGDYQIKYEEYLEQNIGFRTFFVRLNNQISYSLFTKAKAAGVVIGKENYLYELDYIKDYIGTNYKGDSTIDSEMKKLLVIKNKLLEKNIDLIFVFAPGKATFFPEFIPDEYIKKQSGISNYKAYLNKCKEYGITFLDLNSLFAARKKTEKYPLYTKCGIHWSVYGSVIAADTISRFIEKLRNVDLPEIIIDDIELSNIPRETDNDIADGMNLLFNFSMNQMAYPKYHINSDNKTKPKVLCIADSYYWNIYGSGLAGALFEHSGFWYYFNEIYPPKDETHKLISQINVVEELEKNDVVMFLVTEGTMHKYPFGFIDKVYNEYSGNPILVDTVVQNKFIKYKNAIINNAEWLENIKNKAIIEKISLEEMITKNVMWMIENEKTSNNSNKN